MMPFAFHRAIPFRSALLLPPFLQNRIVKLLLLLLLLWGFFHLSGNLIVEGLATKEGNDNIDSEKTVKASDGKEEAPKKLVVPSFRGSAMDGANNANTASQQSNSNSVQAIENSKNDHYATDS